MSSNINTYAKFYSSTVGKVNAQIIGAFATLLAGALVLDAALSRNIGYHMSYWGHSLLAVLYAFSILLVVLYAGCSCLAFLRFRPLLFLGQISYGIYLVHGIVLMAVFTLAGRAMALRNTADAGLITLALGLTLGVYVISYRWIERPCLKMGKREKYLQFALGSGFYSH